MGDKQGISSLRVLTEEMPLDKEITSQPLHQLKAYTTIIDLTREMPGEARQQVKWAAQCKWMTTTTKADLTPEMQQERL